MHLRGISNPCDEFTKPAGDTASWRQAGWHFAQQYDYGQWQLSRQRRIFDHCKRLAQREGKFNLAIAALRLIAAYVARPISSSDIAIWTRADRVAAQAKPLI